MRHALHLLRMSGEVGDKLALENLNDRDDISGWPKFSHVFGTSNL